MLTLQAFAVHPPPPTFSIQYFFLHFLFSLQFALLVVYHTRNLQKLYHWPNTRLPNTTQAKAQK